MGHQVPELDPAGQPAPRRPAAPWRSRRCSRPSGSSSGPPRQDDYMATAAKAWRACSAEFYRGVGWQCPRPVEVSMPRDDIGSTGKPRITRSLERLNAPDPTIGERRRSNDGSTASSSSRRDDEHLDRPHRDADRPTAAPARTAPRRPSGSARRWPPAGSSSPGSAPRSRSPPSRGPRPPRRSTPRASSSPPARSCSTPGTTRSGPSRRSGPRSPTTGAA